MGYKVEQIKAVGITNQRETTICWDTNTGEPLYNAIVWPDTRTATLVRELKKRSGAEILLQLCGLPLSTYPSSVKFLWMHDHCEAVKKAYDEGRCSFGTVDSWLIYRLNGGKNAGVHVTDTTNASRTMFMNIHTLKYDATLLDFFEVDPKKLILPKIVSDYIVRCLERYQDHGMPRRSIGGVSGTVWILSRRSKEYLWYWLFSALQCG